MGEVDFLESDECREVLDLVDLVLGEVQYSWWLLERVDGGKWKWLL